jgi:hypothetical protein
MPVDWIRRCHYVGMVADKVSEDDIVQDLPDLTVADARAAVRSSREPSQLGRRTLAARAVGRSGRDDISERIEALLRNESQQRS